MMKKFNILSSIKALAYIKLMETKNNIKQMFAHPAGIIGAILKNVIIIILFAKMPFMFNTKDFANKLISFGIQANILDATVSLILLAAFFINLKKAVDKYYPTQYSAADVNFLFTTPISSRLIYAWSIIKQIFNTLLGSVVIVLSLFLMLREFNTVDSTRGIIFAYTGIILFLIIIKTLKFFLYSLSKRFGIAAPVKTIVFISIGALSAYFALSLVGSQDVLQSAMNILSGNVITGIPVVGWTKELIMSPFSGGQVVDNLIMLVLFAAFMLFIAVYFATDYYEEAIVSTERMKKVNSAYASKNVEEIQQLISKKKIKAKSVNTHWNFRKAYAFLWKAKVINKRNSKGILAEVLKYLIFAAAGGVFGYVFRNYECIELLEIIATLGFIFKNANSSLLEGLEYELKKSYIFLIPGSIKDKILAVNIIPAINILVRNLVIVFSIALFFKTTIMWLLSFWVVLTLINLVSLFAAAAVKVIIPLEDSKNILSVYLKSFTEVLLSLPAAGVGILAYLLLNHIGIALLVFSIFSLFLILWLLYVSEALFPRLEMSK